MEYLKGAFFAAIGIAIFLVVGCFGILHFGPGSERDALNRLGAQLKDPESAQFKDVVLSHVYVCGQVNSKNSMGGYVGYKRFMADRYGNEFETYFESEARGDHFIATLWDEFCKPDADSKLDQVRKSLGIII